MDWSAFTRTLDAYNLHLFAIGTTEITVLTLVKLAISALLLWFVAGRFSRWTLDRLRALDAFPMTHHIECVAVLTGPGAVTRAAET